jgi:glycosyltransferase involved in cell wall biosynthesis
MNSNVLCFDCFPTWGGGEAVLVKQVAQLLNVGYRVTVVCPLTSPLLSGQLPDSVDAVGLPMSTVLTDFARPATKIGGLLSQARLATQLMAIIRRQQVSLVYALGSRSAKAALPAAIILGIPLCWSAHNPYRLGVVDRLLIKRSAAVICVSDGLRQQYAHLAKDGTKLHLVYNGVDVTGTSRPSECNIRQELGLADHDILVVMIGRISPEKGQALFVESLLPLLREFDSVHAAIIGAADDQDRGYEMRVREAIDRSGIAPRFHMAGWRKDIQALLPQVDIVAQTFSREAFSMVILEAMAAARPVAAFDAGGVAEAIVDGITGLVIPPGDVTAMTQAVRRLILNPTERVAMGQAARQRARDMFDDRRVLNEFTAIIREIVP